MKNKKQNSVLMCGNPILGYISNPNWSRRKLKEIAHWFLECPFSQLEFRYKTEFSCIDRICE